MFNLLRMPIAAATVAINKLRPETNVTEAHIIGNTPQAVAVHLMTDMIGNYKVSFSNANRRFITVRGNRDNSAIGYIFAQTDKGVTLIPCTSAGVNQLNWYNIVTNDREYLYMIGELDSLLIADVVVTEKPAEETPIRESRYRVKVIEVMCRGSSAPKVKFGQTIKTEIDHLIVR